MLKSKNQKIISVVVLILLILAGIFFFFAHKTSKETQVNLPITKVEDTTKTQPVVNTTLEINGVSYAGEITEKTSVYDFMNSMRQEGKINFVEKNYIGMGEFITEINGIKNNNEKSWIYYVNGKEASVGVSNYKTNPGDVVSWKYEKSNY